VFNSAEVAPITHASKAKQSFSLKPNTERELVVAIVRSQEFAKVVELCREV